MELLRLKSPGETGLESFQGRGIGARGQHEGQREGMAQGGAFQLGAGEAEPGYEGAGGSWS